ncbi:hypothetical protein V8E51_017687 [Hyaloscypha variabilis]
MASGSYLERRPKRGLLAPRGLREWRRPEGLIPFIGAPITSGPKDWYRVNSLELPSRATLTVEIQRAPASTPVTANARAPPAAEAPAEEAGNEPPVLCLTSELIHPTSMCYGTTRIDGTTIAAAVSPTLTTHGTSVALGNLSFSRSRNYPDVLETTWYLESNTTNIDVDSADDQRVFWTLEAISKNTIPPNLRVGCIVKHEGVPFHFSMKIEGRIDHPKFGLIEFEGKTGALLVRTKPGEKDFTEWARKDKFKDHMENDRGYPPIDSTTIIRDPKFVGASAR